jgi:calcineurin-like phosphoesterase family protein
MINYWYTSDHHFDHIAINTMCKRGFTDVNEMNEVLVQEWNKIVKPNDIVRHLGDFAFKSQASKVRYIFSRLNGQIDLIIGNHEKNALQVWRDPPTRPKNFRSAQHYLEVVDNEQLICLFHYPMRKWHWNYRGAWHLFGHEHGNVEPLGKSFDVGVDSVGKIFPGIGFRPVHFDEVERFMVNQGVGDHHGIPADKMAISHNKFVEDEGNGKE